MNSEIRLRKLSEKDIPGMMEWMHDPEVNRWFRFDAEAMTEERAREFIAGSYTKNTRHYAIVDESDEYLGTISLEEIDEENSHALYAISTRKCAWGSGAALAATQLLLEVAFSELKLERVYLNVLADNMRAKRFYEKAGFRYEGCFHKHLKLRGEWRDWDWYAILRDDYANRND
ncbi:MAG: GNAT family N-acetyltransferase [Anaerolineaceae bacterium]|nr:GNAT family N-acetyltransferase [Anaerolineaceae bacterium]